jgi:hypothetical protein
MGENPLISDGKRRTSSSMGIADNLSENFDASVKNSRPPPPSPTDWGSVERHFEREKQVPPNSKKEMNSYIYI